MEIVLYSPELPISMHSKNRCATMNGSKVSHTRSRITLQYLEANTIAPFLRKRIIMIRFNHYL